MFIRQVLWMRGLEFFSRKKKIISVKDISKKDFFLNF